MPLCLLLLALFRNRQAKGSWQAACDPHLLPYVLEQGSPTGRRKSLLVLALAGLLAVTALAGPAWRQLPQPVFNPQSALVVILDLSKSMDAADIEPSRVARARLKILDLLRERDEGQTALIVYAGDSFVVTPLTDDTDTIAALVHSLSTALMPSQGSRPQRPVRQALDLLRQAGIRTGSLVLITDGVRETDAAQVAAMVTQAGHRLSVIGVGTRQGAPIPATAGGFVRDADGQIVIPTLEESVLERLALNAGGTYVTMQIDDTDIRQIVRSADPVLANPRAEETGFESDRWREEGPWLILLLLPIAVFAFRRGLLIVAICVATPWPDAVLALEWNDLWSNANQRGEQAMGREDYSRAVEEFRDPAWRAAAAYRNGDYQRALDHLEGIDDTDAAYNRGNALARMGRIEEAMKSYERALQRQPDHEDASYNLDLLKQLQQQQQQQDGEQQQQTGGRQEKMPGEQQQQTGQPAGDDQQEVGGEPGADVGQQDPHRSVEEQTGERPAPGEPTPTQSERQEGGTQQQQEFQQQAEQNGERQPDPKAAQGLQDQPRAEAQQATEQWLRRVPDDPAGLLRRKFLYQYSRRSQPDAESDQPW